MNKVIEIRDLNFSYSAAAKTLADINLDVYAGETVGIIGPNGAGKSTLLLHLDGLLNGVGGITICGRPLCKENIVFIRQKVGLVFQDPEDQLFMPTVYEDVAFGPKNQGLNKEAIEERVRSALADVDLTGKKGCLSHHLSLGERKRAAIAAVLSMAPEILVLDEPNSNLDPRTRRHLIKLLSGFSVTKIIATHDLEMVLELCDRVIILDQGRIAGQGRPKEILSDKSLLESHGLEVPLSLSAGTLSVSNRLDFNL